MDGSAVLGILVGVDGMVWIRTKVFHGFDTKFIHCRLKPYEKHIACTRAIRSRADTISACAAASSIPYNTDQI